MNILSSPQKHCLSTVHQGDQAEEVLHTRNFSMIYNQPESKIMRLLWIICNGLTYWLEHTDQGDGDPPSFFLASPWRPPPVFCTALILIYNFEGVAIEGGSNCCLFDLGQTKVSAHHLSVHGRVCKLETCSIWVLTFSGIREGDKTMSKTSGIYHQ